jgi:hypothetical protein
MLPSSPSPASTQSLSHLICNVCMDRVGGIYLGCPPTSNPSQAYNEEKVLFEYASRLICLLRCNHRRARPAVSRPNLMGNVTHALPAFPSVLFPSTRRRAESEQDWTGRHVPQQPLRPRLKAFQMRRQLRTPSNRPLWRCLLVLFSTPSKEDDANNVHTLRI